MHLNPTRGPGPWIALKRTTARTLFLGLVAATAGGLGSAACGAALCVADGLPWACAGAWGVRGAFAGLAAGAIMGAVSGIYHVEEAAQRKPAAAEQRMVKAAPLRARLAAFFRGRAPSRN